MYLVLATLPLNALRVLTDYPVFEYETSKGWTKNRSSDKLHENDHCTNKIAKNFVWEQLKIFAVKFYKARASTWYHKKKETKQVWTEKKGGLAKSSTILKINEQLGSCQVLQDKCFHEYVHLGATLPPR